MTLAGTLKAAGLRQIAEGFFAGVSEVDIEAETESVHLRAEVAVVHGSCLGSKGRAHARSPLFMAICWAGDTPKRGKSPEGLTRFYVLLVEFHWHRL